MPSFSAVHDQEYSPRPCGVDAGQKFGRTSAVSQKPGRGGRAIFLPAFHSSSLPDGRYGGCPASIFLDVAGARLYHAGDTCLNSEMKTIKELYAPQVAMLPIGGNYTMDVEHAAIAAKWLGVKTVIPMHYGTFPEIEADVEKFIKLVNMNNTSVGVLNPDQI